MLQEAWIAIAEKEYGQTDEYYSAVGYRAIEACYRKDRRYRKALEKYSARYEFDATYKHKKYFLKVAKKIV